MMKSMKNSEDGRHPKSLAGASATDGARRNRCSRESGGLKGAFTRYVKELDVRGEPSRKSFDELWEALRAALVYELRRCSLWTASPAFLGVYGWNNWKERDDGPGRQAGALDDLMNDVYSHVFLKRLSRLKSQLEVKPEIDGLVFLYIRNFVHDRRKAHDPLGFRVFENLRIAIRQAVAGGDLRVVEGDPKITNSTVLAFASSANREGPAEAGDAQLVPPSPPGALKAEVDGWSHDLIPGIMTASGAERQELVDQLRAHILELETAGIGVFRFRDLIGPMKRETRSRWAAIFAVEGGASISVATEESTTAAASVVHPDERPVARDSFRKLSGRIADRLEKIDVPKKTRRYLRTLWTFLGSFACDAGMETLPSNRKLATLLAIPRERLPGLYDLLREVVRLDASPLGLADEVRRATFETSPGGGYANSSGASP